MLADLFALALGRYQSGALQHSEQLCRQILQSDATHAGAWHLLGVLAVQQSRPSYALDYIGKALALQPDASAFYLNHGVALQALGRMQEAASSFSQAVRLQPDLAEDHNNLANARYELGQSEPALA